MNDMFENSGTFTRNAWEWLYETVDHDQFMDRDAELIYQSLENDFQPVHFGKYLQHFIFKKTGMEGVYTDLTVKDYQTIIQDAFRDNRTPASFTPSTAKLSALAKNWLTQQSVKRQAVLLMGFGLKMSVAEVNEFLYKALLEPLLNEQNPFEALCRYCYQHGCGYHKFQQLLQIYEQLDPDHPDLRPLYEAQPAGRMKPVSSLQDDVRLINSLASLKKQGAGQLADVTMDRFLSLYDEARRLIFTQALDVMDTEARLLARRLRENLSRSQRLYDFEKQEKVRQAEEKRTALKWEDISESDLEQILCSAIPMDANGNLISTRLSTLNAQFEGKRFSRKRINNILLRKSEPDRFDLITLNFLIFSLRVEEEPNAKKRYMRFIESTNRILSDCFMGPLYVTNPYECFVLMCMLSVSPLETYNDVIEKSYRPDPDADSGTAPENIPG